VGGVAVIFGVAGVALALFSPLADPLHGQTLVADGGLSLVL